MRLALFGGSFNPIHNGHLSIANQVCDKLKLDRILFIPTADPPHKRGASLASAMDRYEMVRLAIANIPCFAISDIEMQRTGKSYSIDTVRKLLQQLTPSIELHFVIGLDAFLDLDSWKEPRELLRACQFVVVPRPGQFFQSLARISILPKADLHELTRLDSGDLPRVDIAIPACPGIICLAIPPCSISASEIRLRIKQGGSLANMLPPSVESYILQNRLYQEGSNQTHI